MVAETPVGKKAKVIVNRDGKKKTISVKIGELEEKKPENKVQREKDNIGITVREITPELADRLGLPDNDGVIISYVERGTSADEAGLKNGDIIKEVNRKTIQNVDDYENAIMDGRNGNILLLVKRGGSSLWVIVKPKE